MKKIHNITLIIDNEDPITLETVIVNTKNDLGCLLSIGICPDVMDKDERKSILMTLGELDSFILALQDYRELLTDRSEDHG